MARPAEWRFIARGPPRVNRWDPRVFPASVVLQGPLYPDTGGRVEGWGLGWPADGADRKSRGRRRGQGHACVPRRAEFVRRSVCPLPRKAEFFALQKVFHDLQDLIIIIIPLELVRSRRIARLFLRRLAVYLVLDFVRVILGKLLAQFFFVERYGLP